MGKYLFMTMLSLVVLPLFAFADADGIGRITREELKAKMEKGEGVIIMDVRSSASFNSSNVRIKGAIRVDPANVEASCKDLPREKPIVTYCT